MAGIIHEYVFEFRGKKARFTSREMGFYNAIAEALNEGKVWRLDPDGLVLVWQDGLYIPR